jgi:hypothetical protein
MTNLEWVRTLNAKEMAEFINTNKITCDCCAYNNLQCYDDDYIAHCVEGHTEWLNSEHGEKPHKCPICGGEMFVLNESIKNDTYYVMCPKCAIRKSAAYKTSEIAVKEWNKLFEKQEANENE